jgi:hypothetical protein
MVIICTIHFLYLWLYIPCGPWPLFQFLNLYTVGRTLWEGDQLVARPLPTKKITQTQNKVTQTSMPRVGFEPTIPVFERAKMVHALDRVANVIGFIYFNTNKFCMFPAQCVYVFHTVLGIKSYHFPKQY